MRITTTTTADLANDLCDALTIRNSRGAAVGGFLFERVATRGMAIGCQYANVSEDTTTLRMTPYLEAWDAAVAKVNAAVKRLSYSTGVKVVSMRYTFSANPKARCYDACTHATGDTCTCICGGANHGMHSGHVVPFFAA